jgi:hypothetical protein
MTLADACDLCGGPGETVNPLVADDYHEHVRLHLHCLNSPDGRARTASRVSADPGYARFLRLGTMGQDVACAACGASHRMSPKASGMGGGLWELNCTSCHRYATLLNAQRAPLERSAYMELAGLQRRFRIGHDTAAVIYDLDALAAELDSVIATTPCTCGGTYSLAALPRCAHCAAIIIDSAFNIAFLPDAED